jgi:Na+-driven multidrug efflux pump
VAKMSVVLLSVLGLPVVLIPDLVLSIFIHDQVTRELAFWSMLAMGLTMPIEALAFVFTHGLLGAGDARRVMLVSIGTQWLLFLPMAYIVGPVLGFGLTGVWIWQGVIRVVQAWIYIALWRGRKWQCIGA